MIRIQTKVETNLKAVRREMWRITRRYLFKYGAFAKTTMQRSMRKRKGPAKEGQPPHSHVGTLRAVYAQAQARHPGPTAA